jgi:hypothetical protein
MIINMNWRKQLKREFGIHFKNSPDELQFLEAFIDDLIKAERKRIIKIIERIAPTIHMPAEANEKTPEDILWCIIQNAKNEGRKEILLKYKELYDRAL